MGGMTPAARIEYARQTLTTGHELSQSIDPSVRDWAAVAYFYSAYHRVRAALLDDPVFTDVAKLHALSAYLTPDDRHASHHQGRRGNSSQGPGINDLVWLLYPVIAREYHALHNGSVEVRYRPPLVAPIGDLAMQCIQIHKLADNGQLVAVAQ